MHFSQRLDSPPPPSQFRRPWSPLELETYSRYPPQPHHHEHSEADASLEVLDLVDYTSMLPQYRDNTSNTTASGRGPYYADYPPTPPRSFSLASRSSFPSNPPSLVSGHTSTAHSRSPRLRTPPPLHRPFSLPPPRIPRSPPTSSSGRTYNYPWLVEPQVTTEQEEEVDIAAFPEWSRDWYRSQKSNKPMIDPYTPIPTFDPAHIPSSFDGYDGYYPPQSHSSATVSHRNLLPWSPDDEGPGVRVSSEMKEERLRMLEREFGRNNPKPIASFNDGNVIGSVNAKGNIITPGPKKRVLMRWLQGIFALGAAIASLYSALVSR